MTISTSTTYYLLRAKSTTVGDGPYVGLAPDGAHIMVPEHLQARRFPTIGDAEQYVDTVSEVSSAFEIEVRTAA